MVYRLLSIKLETKIYRDGHSHIPQFKITYIQFRYAAPNIAFYFCNKIILHDKNVMNPFTKSHTGILKFLPVDTSVPHKDCYFLCCETLQ